MGLAVVAIDSFAPRPKPVVKDAFLVTIPPNPYLIGFANERHWLFAHRLFRNRCVLEAMASSGEAIGIASQPSSISPVSFRVVGSY